MRRNLIKEEILFVAIMVALLAIPAYSQRRGPAATVKAFYRFSSARSNIFDRRHIELRKGWYTNELYHLFLDQLKKDEAHLRAHPTDKPYFGDGLDFEPLHELCNAGGKSYPYSRKVGRPVVEKSVAYIDVTFFYPRACKIPADVWRVKLQRVGSRWFIADWIWPEGSSLAADMKANNL